MKRIVQIIIAGIVLIVNAKAQTGTWITKKEMGYDLTARSSSCMTSLNGKLYIIGGFNGCGPKDFTEYDPATRTGRKLKRFDGGCGNVIGGALHAIQGNIYLFSGAAGVRKYDPVANTWATVSNYLAPNLDPDASFVINDTVFMISGIGNYFFSYNILTNTFTQRADHPGAANIAASHAFEVNGMGYWGGGFYGSTLTPGFYEYDPVVNSWTPKANLPKAIRGGVAGSYNGKGYLGLGEYWDTPTSSVNMSQFWYEYDPVGNNWVQKQNVMGVSDLVINSTYCLNNSSIAVVGNELYVFGGTIRTNYLYRDNIYAYNAATDNWRIAEWETGANRTEAAAFHINGKIYVAAGHDDESLSDFWEYDMAADTWTEKDTLLHWFYYTQRAAAEVNGKGYLVGGYDKNIITGSKYIDSLMEYDPGANTWTARASYPGGERCRMVALSYNNKLYAGMGTDNNNLYGHREFYEFDPSNNTWTQLTPAPVGFDGRTLSYFTIGDTAYVLSGQYSGSCYKYAFLTDTWASVPVPEVNFTGVVTNSGFEYNGKGYVIATNGGTNRNEIIEFDPASGTWKKILNVPFFTYNHTIVPTSTGIYFGFGADVLVGQNTNAWRKLELNNTVVSREQGIFQAKDAGYSGLNYEMCGTGQLAQGSSHTIQDSVGNLFATIYPGTNTIASFCAEVNSADTTLAYRTMYGKFGQAYDEHGMFLNKSILITANTQFPASDGSKLRLYYTSDELNKFVQAFNLQYGTNKTIDSIKFMQTFIYGGNDHDPFNNATADFKLYTTTFNTFGTDKYVDLLSYASPYTIAGEIYAVLTSNTSPVGLPSVNATSGDIAVYPNPSSGLITLNIQEANNDAAVTVYTIMGKAVYTDVLKTKQSAIDLGDLSNGVYYITVKNGDKRMTRKILINH